MAEPTFQALSQQAILRLGRYALRPPRPVVAVDYRLAPMYLATAGFDVLRDEGELYVEAMDRAGVWATGRRFEGLMHGFAQFAGAVGAAHRALDEIAGERPERINHSRRRHPLRARSHQGGR